MSLIMKFKIQNTHVLFLPLLIFISNISNGTAYSMQPENQILAYARKQLFEKILLLREINDSNGSCLPSEAKEIDFQDNVKKSVTTYDELSDSDPEWRRLHVRGPESTVQPGYLPRLYRGITKYFKPWFEGSEDFKNMSFQDVLRQQHIVLVQGENGEPNYNGVTAREHNITVTEVVPGRYRHELWDQVMANNRIVFSTKLSAKLRENEIGSRLQYLIDAYKAEPSNDPAFPKAEELDQNSDEVFKINPLVGWFSSFDTIKLPRVSQNIRVHIAIFSKYITHYYPAHKDVPALLEAMSSILRDIKSLSTTNPKSLPLVLELLAQFVYLGAWTHPFYSANFSLTMAQCNFVLSRFGLRGISSSNLDYVAISDQFSQFRKIFQKRVAELNPQVSRIKFKKIEDSKLTLMAHLQDRGDVFFSEGENIEDSNKQGGGRIEGLLITPALAKNVELEYMGHISYVGDSPWIKARRFLGTRGESKGLEGIAFRLSGPESSKYSIHYQVRIQGKTTWSNQCSDGEYCGTRGESRPITGLKVWVNPK